MSENHPEAENNFDFKIDLAEMLTGGVIVTVSNGEEAKIAEEAGARAVAISEREIGDASVGGKVIRMTNPEVIQKIQESVSIPVIAKCRIGHFAEAQILESMFVDFIDESETLTPADEENFINKHAFRIPFVSGCSDFKEALRRVAEGAVMLRTVGDHGTGNIASAVKCIRSVFRGIRSLMGMDRAELISEAQRNQAPVGLMEDILQIGRLPVPFYASGGILTPADAALMIQLGAESVFVDLEIYQSDDPLHRIRAIVGAVSHYRDPEKLTQASLGDVSHMEPEQQEKGKEDFLTSRTNW